MVFSFGTIMKSITKKIILGSLLDSLNREVKKYKNSRNTFHEENIFFIISMMQNSYEISAYAQCDDEYRKGFSYGQDLRFYHRGGFDTFDGAFGFMTEQVEETKSQFMNSTFYYYSSKESSHHQEARKYMYYYDN